MRGGRSTSACMRARRSGHPTSVRNRLERARSGLPHGEGMVRTVVADELLFTFGLTLPSMLAANERALLSELLPHLLSTQARGDAQRKQQFEAMFDSSPYSAWRLPSALAGRQACLLASVSFHIIYCSVRGRKPPFILVSFHLLFIS